MDASPDSLVYCRCCGNGVVEVKCPYSCRDQSLFEKSNNSQFFLKVGVDGKLFLDVTHAQAQLKFCDANYCDFFVW